MHSVSLCILISGCFDFRRKAMSPYDVRIVTLFYIILVSEGRLPSCQCYIYRERIKPVDLMVAIKKPGAEHGEIVRKIVTSIFKRSPSRYHPRHSAKLRVVRTTTKIIKRPCQPFHKIKMFNQRFERYD